MSDIWAFIISFIILIIIYGYISSKLSNYRKNKLREHTIPLVPNSITQNINYNIYLSDGRKFENIKIIGSIEGEEAEVSFAGWEGILVLEKQNKKKIYIKKSSIRFIEEV